MFGHTSFETIALNVMDKLLEIQYLILFVRSNIIVVNVLFALPFPPFLFLFILQELAITSDEALSLEELPKRVVILGGGCASIS